MSTEIAVIGFISCDIRHLLLGSLLLVEKSIPYRENVQIAGPQIYVDMTSCLVRCSSLISLFEVPALELNLKEESQWYAQRTTQR